MRTANTIASSIEGEVDKKSIARLGSFPAKPSIATFLTFVSRNEEGDSHSSMQ